MTPKCVPSRTAGRVSGSTACSCSIRLDRLVSSSALLEGVPAALLAAFKDSTTFLIASLHAMLVSTLVA